MGTIDRPDFAALIRNSAKMITDVLEQSAHPARQSIEAALAGGSTLSVRCQVLPKPRLLLEIHEPEGARHELLEIKLSAPPTLERSH
ncbi:MAG: hypothetical protein Q8M53_07040 [Burkholderiales bacterium]|nr:hypothetical protein [Burkholderiales bacterium]